ncbi:MAG: hypothetical protein Pg6B_09830 [Candidatus Azobacteroides pseudotrichonymphae]|nr:MAG: hypothetical protein Pg6B_09830 [Candidatus Azobacteroides pseudotrichonymphae]
MEWFILFHMDMGYLAIVVARKEFPIPKDSMRFVTSYYTKCYILYGNDEK